MIKTLIGAVAVVTIAVFGAIVPLVLIALAALGAGAVVMRRLRPGS